MLWMRKLLVITIVDNDWIEYELMSLLLIEIKS